MPRQFAVIGLGRFGYSVVETLVKHQCEVLAIDNDEEKVAAVSDFATYAVQCDATDEKALRTVGIQNVDVAVVSIGENIESSILIVMTLKELGVKEVIAKAVTPIHGKILRNLGVSRVVFPEREVAVRLAHSLVSPRVLEYLELSENYSIVEIPAPEPLVGQTLRESQLRNRYGVNVIAIKRKVPFLTEDGETDFTEEIKAPPLPDDRIEEGDVLVVVGSNPDLERLRP